MTARDRTLPAGPRHARLLGIALVVALGRLTLAQEGPAPATPSPAGTQAEPSSEAVAGLEVAALTSLNAPAARERLEKIPGVTGATLVPEQHLASVRFRPGIATVSALVAALPEGARVVTLASELVVEGATVVATGRFDVATSGPYATERVGTLDVRIRGERGGIRVEGLARDGFKLARWTDGPRELVLGQRVFEYLVLDRVPAGECVLEVRVFHGEPERASSLLVPVLVPRAE